MLQLLPLLLALAAHTLASPASDTTPPPPRPIETRVALLTLGQSDGLDTIGIHIRAEWLAEAAAAVREEGAQVVVLRLRSGGGVGAEPFRLATTVERDLRPSVRTIVWVDRAVDGAVLPAWAAHEICMTPDGFLGVSGSGSVAPRAMDLSNAIAELDRLSAAAGRPAQVLRSMALREGLAVRPAAAPGTWEWAAAADEKRPLFPSGAAVHFAAPEALRYGLISAVASTREELVAALKIEHAVWIGDAADQSLRERARDADARAAEFTGLLSVAKTGAAAPDPASRERARVAVAKMQSMAALDPALLHLGRASDRTSSWDPDWLASLAARLTAPDQNAATPPHPR